MTTDTKKNWTQQIIDSLDLFPSSGQTTDNQYHIPIQKGVAATTEAYGYGNAVPSVGANNVLWQGIPVGENIVDVADGFRKLIFSCSMRLSETEMNGITEVFLRSMYDTPAAWKQFFGRTVPGLGQDAFKSEAIALKAGRGLDYEVLFKKYGGSSNMLIERMIENCALRFPGESGIAYAKVLTVLSNAYQHRTPQSNFMAKIGT